jgi:hypothetical protein
MRFRQLLPLNIAIVFALVLLIAAAALVLAHTLAPSENNGLLISSIDSTTPTETSVTLTWTTNAPSDSQVVFGPTLSPGSQTIEDPALVTSHAVRLDGLSSSTLYHYQVISRTPEGQVSASAAHAFMTLVPPASPDEAITSPLRKHPVNPRYFTDDAGRAIYLTGSHFWTTIQDRWIENPQPAFKTFEEYLSFIKTRGHNFTRLWVFDHYWYQSDPSPWVRAGPGIASDGQPKWDVSMVNQAYIDQLRSRVQQFRDHGIYVSVMLFRGNYAPGNHPSWHAHPFNPVNNVNANLARLSYDAYNGLNNIASLGLQKQYVDRVIDALNDMDNVIWEIANEGQPAGIPWQQAMVAHIRSYESTKPEQHLVGMTATLPNDNARLYASNADWIAPGGSSGDFYDANNPPVADGSRIIISDTDHHLLFDVTTSWPWKSFLRGEHPILMENELAADLEAVRQAMSHTRRQAERMDLAGMTPQNGLSQTAYCLANPGTEYLIYAPSAGTFWVDLSAGGGKRFSVEWINPRTAATTRLADLPGGNSRQSFTAPFNDSGAVLYLKESGASTAP